jgi:hypothetical protein
MIPYGAPGSMTAAKMNLPPRKQTGPRRQASDMGYIRGGFF